LPTWEGWLSTSEDGEDEDGEDEEIFGVRDERDLAISCSHAMLQQEELNPFRRVQDILAANEGIFEDFVDKLECMNNILLATPPQLHQLEASSDQVNDTLDLCDDLFTRKGMFPTWNRYCSRFGRQVKRMVERVEKIAIQIADPLKAMVDTTALGTTLKTMLGLKALTCALCLEKKFATTTCSECFDANICGDCYSTQVLAAREGGLSATHKALSFACVMSPRSGCEGIYSQEVLQKMISVDAIHALRDYSTEVVRQEETLARRMETRRQVETMTPIDRMYDDEFKRLSQTIGNFCPTCLTPFADFVGCAAVICGSCSQKFCALCLDPCPLGTEEHEHVRHCRLQHRYKLDEGEGVFVSLENWKQGRARILNDELIVYVRALPFNGQLSDGRMLKDKLLETFSNPHTAVPRECPWRRQLPRPIAARAPRDARR
jgi:hypothetical protein